jgi:hypothetical protein
MPRGYELEDFFTPRDVSEGREPTSEQFPRETRWPANKLPTTVPQ